MSNPPTESSMEETPFPFSPLWDWSDFLDFGLDGDFNISTVCGIDSDEPPTAPELELPPAIPNLEIQGRVRKRDPRLTCANFLAGRVPCACPELDEKLEEQENGLPGKKRARAARTAATATCQVPGCESDISGLKGYHRRHRVCLRCASAGQVVLDGQRKRYCQQCGKFHILSDFDEGKRSCRRKLERHNNRRRRKPKKPRDAADREPQYLDLADDVACNNENIKDSTCLSSQMVDKEATLESEDRQVSPLSSDPGSHSIQNDGGVSFMALGEAQIEGEKDGSKYARSSPNSDSKSTLSAMCHTGRISFKLYDWNPAEFPRRLRQQIFQWLSSMPVELEGYIRPGCTILTIFIAMPNFMWSKLLEDPVKHIHDLVTAPGSMLSGRGAFLVYLENMTFRVTKDESLLLVREQAPRLHYIHPTCFEAGKPLEFVACGSNLLQPKFRFLVSFAGKYLAPDRHAALPHGNIGMVTASSDHQLLKIRIPHTEADLFGPAFIEVENESGISNFIPILIGNKEICSEMNIMEQRFEATFHLKGSKFMDARCLSDSCEVLGLRQTAFSQFILDITWLLRKPSLEDVVQIITPFQIGRYNRVLTFLIQNESTSLLERVVHFVEIVMNTTKLNNLANCTTDTDMKSLQSMLDYARKVLHERLQDKRHLVQHSGNLSVSSRDQHLVTTERGNLDSMTGSSFPSQNENSPLLNREIVVSMKAMKEIPRKPCSCVFSHRYRSYRPLIFAVVATAVCFGICAVVLHPPQSIDRIATTIRRCLFNET
ncbi:hypothetical protein NMG60_11025183 [Bertholletia excelsa]